MKVNQDRLWEHLQTLAAIGRNPDGSITRLPFTKQDQEAQDLIRTYMQQAGLSVEIDPVGNVIGKWMDQTMTGKPVVTGSHYDSVIQGGMFDGCLGILGAIEAITVLKESGYKPNRPIYCIGFKDEEGNRFGYGMIGSKAINGLVSDEDLLSKDEKGISLQQAMVDFQLEPSLYKQCQKTDFLAMIELHIEQGKVLEQKHKQIGIVTGIAGLSRYTITIYGESGHAGATQMKGRMDPMIPACELVLRIQKKASMLKDCVATVGKLETSPGACNIICDHVMLSLDVRSIDPANIDCIIDDVKAFLNQIPFQSTLEHEQSLNCAPCSQSIQEQIIEVCQSNDLSFMSLMSGAGHDAMNFYEHCPIGMIFVESHKGYSHRKEEYTSPISCAQGTLVLAQMLQRLGQ